MNVADEIHKNFEYLFADGEFELYSETYFQAFSNWEVVLRSRAYWLKFVKDRGEIQLLLAPNVPTASENLLRWYNLGFVLWYLTGDSCTPDKTALKFNETNSQLADLANIYKPYVNSIRLLLDPDKPVDSAWPRGSSINLE